MKRKGFTLIELLAVIVVLTIIALIATPTILGVIEKARKGAAESSAIGYIDAVEKQIMLNEVDTNASEIKDGSYSIDDLSRLGVSVKGTLPSNGTLKIENGQVSNYIMSIDNYVVENGKATKVSKVNEAKENGTVIYFDPVKGEKCDTYKEENSTTGTKTGCMKWYIFNDSKDNSTVNMILDHNTTARVAWNSSGSNEKGMKEVAEALVNDTNNWKVPGRLISAYEVANIVGNNKFNINSEWYYLDKNSNGNFGQVQIVSGKGSSSYAWLYDRTRRDCEEYGCANNEDSNINIYGYWTKTSRKEKITAYSIRRDGYLNVSTVQIEAFGVRPVIMVSKDLVY